MRHRVRVLAISALAIGLAAAGCSKTTDSNNGAGGKDDPNAKSIILDFEGKTPTPAPEVKDARKGGQITVLVDGQSEHLAPQMIYVGDALSAATNLFHRTLTGYKEDPNGGPLTVVGDLAKDAGKVSADGKVWTYTLRDGIKFEDGSPITSKDVAYGLGLSFGQWGTQGPQYVQNILDPKREYKGPTEEPGKPVPGITTPDDKTIVFTLTEAHPEFPYLLTYTISTPVPAAKFTKEKYEFGFVSTGPYKIKEYKADTYLLLEKNPNWDPKTDPMRHQYVDTVKYDYAPNRTTQTQRVIASQGEDATAITTSDVAAESIATVSADAELSKRVISGPTPYANYININTARVTDVDVRRALNYMIDRDAIIKDAGGSKIAAPSTTILAKIVPGYKKFDAYPTGPNGDPAKAKALLAGKTVPKLSFCFANTATGQKAAAVVKASLERENLFQIALNPVDRKDYYTTIGKKGNSCDLMRSGWGQDFPDGESTLGVLMDGNLIVDAGNNNYSYFNDPGINAKLKELRTASDRAKAAKEYGDLDEKIMKDFAPLIPTTYSLHYSIVGTKVGGAFLSPLYSQVNLTNVYVKA